MGMFLDICLQPPAPGFCPRFGRAQYPWQRVASQFNMTAASVDLVDLGAAPMPTNSKNGITVQDMVERTLTVKPTDWDITVWISHNAVKDDQTSSLERKVRNAGQNFQKHINKRVFEVLNGWRQPDLRRLL